MLSQADRDLIIQFLSTELSPAFIILFGSAARGEMRLDSDIDLAYYADMELTDYERFMVAQELATILNKDVDLVDLKKASTVFQTQIITTGEYLLCHDQYAKDIFTIQVLKKYARLNEERKRILDRVEKEGKIYDE